MRKPRSGWLTQAETRPSPTTATAVDGPGYVCLRAPWARSELIHDSLCDEAGLASHASDNGSSAPLTSIPAGTWVGHTAADRPRPTRLANRVVAPVRAGAVFVNGSWSNDPLKPRRHRGTIETGTMIRWVFRVAPHSAQAPTYRRKSRPPSSWPRLPGSATPACPSRVSCCGCWPAARDRR